MQSKLLLPLVLILIITITTLGTLGVKLVRDERQLLRTQFMELHAARLRDYRDHLVQELDRMPDIVTSQLEQCRRLERLAQCESSFIESVQLFDKEQFERWSASSGNQRSSAERWVNYYSEQGLRFALLWKTPDERERNHVVATISKVRLYAALIASLPSQAEIARMIPGTSVRLLDEYGHIVHSWGQLDADETIESAVLPLDAPLQHMHLRYLAPRRLWDRPFYSSALLLVVPGVSLIVAALVLLTTYFYREHTREVHDAALRVSFVNQVSHELKTPLTNIRMYAELLQRQFEGAEQSASAYIAVVVSESQRLSRLINSILNFSLHEKSKLHVHPAPGDLRKCIEEAVLQFLPRLYSKGIRMHLEEQNMQSTELCFDSDALQQILSNLLANAEKYAAEGQWIRLRYFSALDHIRITVSDRGPGIPLELRERVFEAFYRISDAITEVRSGAGIGLHISRELARLHGGDIKILDSECGAVFEVVLSTKASTAPMTRAVGV